MQELRDPRLRLFHDLGVAAEAVQELNAGLLPKPGGLTLGVPARIPAGIEKRVLDAQFPFDHLQCLLVADRLERFAAFRETELQDRLRLFDQAVPEHLPEALLEACVESVTVGEEAEFQDSEAFERVPPAGVHVLYCGFCTAADFHGADQLRRVV